MRHSLIGYLVAVTLGAAVGTFTAIATAHAFVAADGATAVTTRDALKQPDQVSTVQDLSLPRWQDELELSMEDANFPVDERS